MSASFAHEVWDGHLNRHDLKILVPLLRNAGMALDRAADGQVDWPAAPGTLVLAEESSRTQCCEIGLVYAGHSLPSPLWCSTPSEFSAADRCPVSHSAV